MISSTRLRNSGLNWRWSSSSICRAHGLGIGLGHFHDDLAAEVGGHDQDRILEIHGPALAVGHPAVVEHLQQHVEHIGMGLFDLVEQDDRIGPPPHRLGEHAALVITDIAGRGADQAGHRMFFHVLRHVDPDHGLLGVKEEIGQAPGQFGLAHTGRARGR